jgi:2-phosphoglycolate phosphatase
MSTTSCMLKKSDMRAVLFDLDGTLVDTAPDLGYALNLQRRLHHLDPLPDAVIRPYASHGTCGLLKIGFNLTPQAPTFAGMREAYLELYDEVFCRRPMLFEGVAELLQDIEQRGLPWGVATNKPARFTLPMMELLGLRQRACCVVSGDDCVRSKPHPDMLLLASERSGVAPAESVYVGDAERDIVAGRAAGMNTIVACYGYLSVDDCPAAWGANGMIERPVELLQYLF